MGRSLASRLATYFKVGGYQEVSEDRCEAELLGKEYEEKYKQVAEI